MVNLKKLREEQEALKKGEIIKVEEMPLKEYLKDPEIIKKFKEGITRFPKYITTDEEKEEYRENKLNGNVLCVFYSIENAETGVDETYSEFYNIIWSSRSNLYNVAVMNNLDKDDTDSWVGQPIQARRNKDGNMRLLGNNF